MRLVVQRVSSASVVVGGEVVSSIGRGLCVLVGLREIDTQRELVWMANKLLKIRLFEDGAGRRWAEGVQGAGLELLCVSQFTLYCDLKGNKPDYRHAMAGDCAKNSYGQFLDILRKTYCHDKIKDGVFGAMMQVNLVNDGPVTVTLDSPDQPPTTSAKHKSRAATAVTGKRGIRTPNDILDSSDKKTGSQRTDTKNNPQDEVAVTIKEDSTTCNIEEETVSSKADKVDILKDNKSRTDKHSQRKLDSNSIVDERLQHNTAIGAQDEISEEKFTSSTILHER